MARAFTGTNLSLRMGERSENHASQKAGTDQSLSWRYTTSIGSQTQRSACLSLRGLSDPEGVQWESSGGYAKSLGDGDSTGLPPQSLAASGILSSSSEARVQGIMRISARPTIGIIVITLNEERNIAACLESAQWVDEIVFVDAQSQDRTVEIARRFTSKVFVRAWPGFGPQWNFGLDQQPKAGVSFLAQEKRFPLPLGEEIRTVLAAGPQPDVAGK